MTSHRLFVLFLASYLVAAGIGVIALGIDLIASSPILGEDGRPTGIIIIIIIIIILGVGCMGLAANGIKMNFFTKPSATTTAPTKA